MSIQVLRGPSVSTDNPVLAEGQPYVDIESNPPKLKIGDGSTGLNDLPYIGASVAESATKATQDGSGNLIVDTYATKEELSHSGKRTCRFVIGTSANGWTASDCDYLCDAISDEAEINQAIQALPQGSGEIVILDGTYNIGSPILMNKSNTSFIGNGKNTVLKRTWDSSSGFEGIINITSDGCSVQNIFFYGDRYSFTSSYNAAILLNASYSIISNNAFHGISEGVVSNSSSDNLYNRIVNNTYNDLICCIDLTNCPGTIISYNQCSNSTTGIHLTTSNSNIISYNSISCDESLVGIWVNNGSQEIIVGNICTSSSSGSGIQLDSTSTSNVFANSCLGHTRGISLTSSDQVNITGNTCVLNSQDIQSEHNYPIYVDNGCTNLIVSNNNLPGKKYSDQSGNNTNTFFNNKWDSSSTVDAPGGILIGNIKLVYNEEKDSIDFIKIS